MNKTHALLGASLILGLAVLACKFESLRGASPTPELPPPAGLSTPATLSPTPDPSIPTNTDGAETIVIPGGTFWMGSEDSEALADEDELPRHQVTLRTFPIYTHEVTNAMYARCVDAGACIPIQVLEAGPTSHYADPAFAEYPVVGVDWNMANDYCSWAGARLPTEAEWEYAARGTDSLTYPWGTEEPACDRVNMLGCLVPPDTVKVGSYQRGNSPFEVWDMSGNVWEWTHDWYDPDYYALSPSNSPVGPNYPEDPENPQKVARGGGLNSEPTAMRSAARVGARPLRPFDDVGFRCVAQPALDLPDGYAEVPEGHEWVPPDPLDGGGETVEDPDEERFASMGGSYATCPDADGRMRVIAEAETNEPGEWSVTVEGIPYSCSYDDAAHVLSCAGPVPGSTEFPGVYHVMIFFPGGGLIGHQYPDVPTDCPVDWIPPLDLTVTADCPDEAGMTTVYFHYEPGLTVDTVLVGGAEVMWWPVGANQTNAMVPGLVPGGFYLAYLHGTDAGGRDYAEWPTVLLPDECATEPRAVTVAPVCYLDRPSISVSTMPDTMTMDSLSVGGAELPCVTIALGHYVCGDLTDPPGSEVTVNLCFDGDPCFDDTVTVPSCPGDAEIVHRITPGCYETLGPVVAIEYAPADQPLVAANANGADLTCVDSPTPGLYMCYTLPGAAGSTMTITFCLADGACYSQDVIVEDCGIEAEPFGEEWSLVNLGCHSETDIFFVLDTGLEWLVDGALFSVTASDGDTDYICSLHPTIPRALYCSGEQPDAAGPLEVCIQQSGDPAPTCVTFSDWAATVGAIEECTPRTEPEEPGQPVDACAQWTDQETCEKMHYPCRWDGRACYTP